MTPSNKSGSRYVAAQSFSRQAKQAGCLRYKKIANAHGGIHTLVLKTLCGSFAVFKSARVALQSGAIHATKTVRRWIWIWVLGRDEYKLPREAEQMLMAAGNNCTEKDRKMSVKKSGFRMTSRVADHLINAALIFTSVFLAFWMNDVRDEKQSADLTSTAKNTIIKELKSNLHILERWAPYHKNILDQGESFFENDADTIERFDLRKIPGLDKGIQREIISNYGLALVEDGRIHLDINTKILVHRIYKQHEYVLKATSKITDDFLRQRELLDKTKAEENYLIFYSLVGELWGQEIALMERLQEAIQELEK